MFGVLLSLILKLKKSKVDKVSGKGLSSNDLTDELKERLLSLNNTKLITSSKLLIENDSITLTDLALGDCMFNSARIYEDLSSEYFYEYSCNINSNGDKGLFETNDRLNGKYAIITYLTYRT